MKIKELKERIRILERWKTELMELDLTIRSFAMPRMEGETFTASIGNVYCKVTQGEALYALRRHRDEQYKQYTAELAELNLEEEDPTPEDDDYAAVGTQ